MLLAQLGAPGPAGLWLPRKLQNAPRLAISLFKNKNGFTRPWHSCSLTLVTTPFPGALASGSPRLGQTPLAPLTPTTRPRQHPPLPPNLPPNLTGSPRPHQPGWASTVHLSLDFCGLHHRPALQHPMWDQGDLPKRQILASPASPLSTSHRRESATLAFC